MLRGLSSRPINHSLIRAHRERSYTLRPHISTTDSQLSMVLLLHFAFQAPSFRSFALRLPSSPRTLQYKAARRLPKPGVGKLNIWDTETQTSKSSKYLYINRFRHCFGCGIRKHTGGRSVDLQLRFERILPSPFQMRKFLFRSVLYSENWQRKQKDKKHNRRISKCVRYCERRFERWQSW